MYKILIGIILIMTALTACATPPQMGTGGYDPETQALLAIATQTGAAALISQTQAAQSATAQAIYAEQTAVSSYATATQVTSENATIQVVIQETAVSATETRIYEPVGVQQTRDAQAVLMARENTASTATAEAIHLEMRQATKAAERWDRFWKGFMWFLAGLGAALVIAAINIALRFHKPVPPVYSDMGTVEAVDNRFYQLTNNVRPSYRAQPIMIDQPKEEPKPLFTAPTPTKTVKFTQQNGEQTALNVNDRHPDIDPMKWQIFAAAVLIDEIPPTRRAITEHNAYISQEDHKLIYDYMIDNELAAGTGAGGGMVVNGKGYEFLVHKIPSHLWNTINLPHPDGLEPVFD